MKYEFIKVAEDVYKLKYKEKEFEFKCNVNMAKEIQEITMQSRLQMIQDYAKQGRSIKELIIEEKKDGKTYYDNSNKIALEEAYREKLTLEYMDNKCFEMFGMNLGSLLGDIGLTSNEETEKFFEDLSRYMSGNIPSK